MTNAEMAERLGLSTDAINSRLHRLYERTGLEGRTAAVVFAIKHMECCVEPVAL
jgi:DNA-binding NarL/FixJ family response regulator